MAIRPSATNQPNEHPVISDIAAIEGILSNPHHTPEDLSAAVNGLMQRLSGGDVMVKPTLERAIIGQARQRVDAVLNRSELQNHVEAGAILGGIHGYLETLENQGDVSQPEIPESVEDFSAMEERWFARSTEEGAEENLESRPTREELREIEDVVEEVDEIEAEASLAEVRHGYLVVRDYMEVGNNTKYRDIIGTTMARYLKDAADPAKAEADLTVFLNRSVRKVSAITGGRGQENLIAMVQQESTAASSERKHALEQKIAKDKRRIAQLERDKTAVMAQMDQIRAVSGVKEAPTTAAQRDVLSTKEENIRSQISAAEEEIAGGEEQLRLISAAEKNKGAEATRVPAETLLIYIHQFFKLQQTKEREGAGFNEQAALPAILQEAVADAAEDVTTYEIRHSEKDENPLRRVLRRGIKIKQVIGFITEKTVPQWKWLKESSREGVAAAFKGLQENPTEADLEKFIGNLERAVAEGIEEPKEREKMVQKIVANTIGSLEMLVNPVKWNERGLQPGHFDHITTLKNNLRNSYESHITEEVSREVSARRIDPEKRVEVWGERLQAFHRQIHEGAKFADTRLPKELRQYFNQNDWLRVAGRWSAGATWSLTKGLWKKGGEFGKWSAPHAITGLKKGYEKVRKYPKTAALGAMVALTSLTLGNAAIMTVGYHGLKFAWNKLRKGGGSAPLPAAAPA